MKKNGVLVIGSANMDLVVRTPRFPAPGETLFGSDFGTFPGGKGANQAVACAKLGGNVDFVGKVGGDIFGDTLARGMKADGVRLSNLAVDRSTPTGIAVITVDKNGQNEIIVASGSNMNLLPKDIDRVRKAFDGAGILLLQLEVPLPTVIRAAEIARSKGVTVILNPAPAQKLPRRLLRLVDYLTPNETELQQLSGVKVRGHSTVVRAAHALLHQGVGHVIVTMGSAGSLLVEEDAAHLFPAFRVKAVDTTAAGDAFNGALAFALASGHPYGEAIPLANAVAALSVTKPGAQSSMPTMKQLLSFLRGR
jgi:ribokinase